jgi:mannose-6-phosphate isomerase-like protein (cupin superfamily)
VEILFEHDALHVTWSRFGPGRDGADPHIHRRHTDMFYVLDGELTLLLADGEVAARAGTLVTIPPLVVHGFRNASDDDLRYLNLHAPGTGFADYMRGLRDGRKVPFDQEDPPPDGTRPSSDITLAETDEVAIADAPDWHYYSAFTVRPA